MAYTEAGKRATRKYQDANCERLTLQFRKGTKEKIEKAAKLKGLSKTAYILSLVEKDIKEK